MSNLSEKLTFVQQFGICAKICFKKFDCTDFNFWQKCSLYSEVETAKTFPISVPLLACLLVKSPRKRLLCLQPFFPFHEKHTIRKCLIWHWTKNIRKPNNKSDTKNIPFKQNIARNDFAAQIVFH